MLARLWLGVLALLLLLPAVAGAGAEEVVETWRSTFGTFRGLSVNAADGSCWVSSGADVLHLSPDGQILAQVRGLSRPTGVSANSDDGSCWVAETDQSRVLHLAPDGAVLTAVADLPAAVLAVSPADGSCAVGLLATYPAWTGVVLLAEDGGEVWRHEIPAGVRALQASPADGAWWAVDNNYEVIRLEPGGAESWRQVLGATSLSVDTGDGSGWVATGTELIHLSPEGAELFRLSSLGPIDSVSVDSSDGTVWAHTSRGAVWHLFTDAPGDAPSGGISSGYHVPPMAASPADGSCWVLAGHWSEEADTPGGGWGTVVHLAGDCTQLWQQGALYSSWPSVSSAPNSCWFAGHDLANGDTFVAQRAADGTLLLQVDAYSGPLAINPADGSIWARGPDDGGWLVHLAADGTEILRASPPVPAYCLASLAVDAADGSCWVIAGGGDLVGEHGWLWCGGLAHIAADGSELLISGDNIPLWSIAVNSTDSSVWVVVTPEQEVVHLTRDGTELYRGLADAASVSVDPADGSCWVGGHGFVAHLAADGTELWRDDSYGGTGGAEGPRPPAPGVAVNTWDHSCWITDRTDVIHLAANGTELSRTSGFSFGSYQAPCPSVNPMDGSCWVADMLDSQLVRLAVVGYPVQRFRDVPRDFWAFDEIKACATAGLVQGYWDATYRPDLPVTRDQMAVYIARALAGGEAAMPTAPAAPTFTDVSPDYWAFQYIEYCAANDVVQGYPGGNYRPAEVVSRGQMAVYIARAIVSPTGDAGLADYTPPAEPTFPDVTADNDWAWCYRYVEYCTANDIVRGYGDGTYHPERAVTRDQMAVYISRAFVP